MATSSPISAPSRTMCASADDLGGADGVGGAASVDGADGTGAAVAAPSPPPSAAAG